MPRRSILSTTEQMSLLTLPESQNDLIRYYTFTETDFALIRQRRGDANRLGFAVQLCLLRYPGLMLGSDMMVGESVIQWVASQIQVDATTWTKYAERDQTRREHFQELRSYLGLSPFGLADFRLLIKGLTDLAMQTDKGLVIAVQATELLRQRQIILPALNVIDRACAEAITLATRRIYKTLIDPLTAEHKQRLDDLLKVKPESGITWLVWLRQSPVKPNSRHMIEQIDRLKTFQKLALPAGIGQSIHQNRLLKMAREGGRMTPQDLAKFEVKRRYATLVALALEGTATVTDQLIDLHDRILVKMFSTAKHKHHQQFQDKGKAINDKVRLYSKVGHALLEAKESDSDPFEAIEKVISWEDFMLSITEADQLSLVVQKSPEKRMEARGE
jgi:Domain of unknown function (DUF4158)